MFESVSLLKGVLRAIWDCLLCLSSRGGHGRAGCVCWETKPWVLGLS